MVPRHSWSRNYCWFLYHSSTWLSTIQGHILLPHQNLCVWFLWFKLFSLSIWRMIFIGKLKARREMASSIMTTHDSWWSVEESLINTLWFGACCLYGIGCIKYGSDRSYGKLYCRVNVYVQSDKPATSKRASSADGARSLDWTTGGATYAVRCGAATSCTYVRTYVRSLT